MSIAFDQSPGNFSSMNVAKLRLAAFASIFCFGFANAFSQERVEPVMRRAELFPASVLAYAEATEIGAAIELVRSHPIKERIFALPAYEALLQSDDLMRFQAGVSLFEAGMGQRWQRAISTVTDRGVSIGLDKSGGVALLLESSDENALEALRNMLLVFLPKPDGRSLAAQNKYRGVTAHQLKGTMLAQLDNILMLTNKPEMAKAIVDQYLDRTSENNRDSLATQANYLQARSASGATSGSSDIRLATAYVDLEAVRTQGIAKDVFQERIDNIVGELVLGGVLTSLRNAPYLAATLELNSVGVELRLNSPHDRNWEAPREYQFGESSMVAAPPMIDLPNRLFALSAHRDVAQMWLRNGDLLTDKAVDEMAKADAQLSLFFSGRDFGEDVLGSFGSGIQVVGRTPDFTDQVPQPAIKLPEFAVVFRMQNAEETKPEMRRTFQSLVGFLNVVGAMEGNPQLDLGMQSVEVPDGVAQLYTASFVAKLDERDSLTAPIQFNFSPTLAFAGESIVFSSSTALAKDLVAHSVGVEPETSDSNTAMMIHGETLKEMLAVNEEQLVASNMLSKGQSKSEAEAEIGLLLELVRCLDSGEVQLIFDETSMTLSTKVLVK